MAQRRFPLAPDENHDLLLAKCQIAAKDIARSLADDLPRLVAGRQAAGAGQLLAAHRPPTQRNVDWTKNVDDVLRTIRAFGSIESFARVDTRSLHVWEATGWREAHPHKPGTLVHRHRRHLVVAARDGFVQLTGWSPSPPGTTRRG